MSALLALALASANLTGTVDFGPDGAGGYPEIDVTGVTAPTRIRVVYATHPDGLGEKGDFWHETRATYLGPEVWLPILPANTDRFDVFEVVSNGTYRAPLAQGLVRYAKWTAETGACPPSEAGDRRGARVAALRLVNDGIHSEEEVVGSFACSDERLNGIWKASVRTCQLAAIPGRTHPLRVCGVHTNALLAPMRPYLSDGAKRDRLVWSGDLWWAQRNMYVAFSPRSPYMPGSIRMLADSQLPCGYIQAAPFPEDHAPFGDGAWGHFGSDEFAAWFVPVLHDHVLHTGDLDLAKEQLGAVRRLLTYLAGQIDGEGLFQQRRETCKGAVGLTFGARSLHHRAYMQILLWKAWRDAAELASWLGEENSCREWAARADFLAAVARKFFWDEKKGGFVMSLEQRDRCRESNQLATSFRFVTAQEAQTVFASHARHRHGKFQALSVRGAFEYGEPEKALAWLFEHNWHRVLEPEWKGLRTTQECMNLIRKGWGDEAHPDTAMAGILSNYVLGVVPVKPGFAEFRFTPPDCSLAFASGTVPTPRGNIVARWERGSDGKIVRHLKCPAGTRCVP